MLTHGQCTSPDNDPLTCVAFLHKGVKQRRGGLAHLPHPLREGLIDYTTDSDSNKDNEEEEKNTDESTQEVKNTSRIEDQPKEHIEEEDQKPPDSKEVHSNRLHLR